MNSEKPIILMSGGSFNPPTKAHIQLLLHAVHELGADKGILVPSSDDYVSRKIKRHGSVPLISFDDRLSILEGYIKQWQKPDGAVPLISLDGNAVALKDRIKQQQMSDRLETSDIERDEHRYGNTYRSLCKLRDRYPDHEIVFLAGDDRLPVLARWGNIESLLKDFRIAVLTRTGQQDIKSIPLLRKYEQRFIFINNQPGNLSNISSSGFWQAFRKKSDDVFDHVTWQAASAAAAAVTAKTECPCANYIEWQKSPLTWNDVL